MNELSTLPPTDEQPSLAAQTARALLTRHGIPKHRQAAFVGEFFGVSRAAAHRRTHATAAWTLEELEAIALNFGETLADLFGGGKRTGGVRATFQVGAAIAPCRVWFQAEGSDAETSAFVAIENKGAYIVVPSGDSSTAGALPVSRIEIDPSLDAPPRIAVLDDDRDVTKSICVGLRDKGYEAVAYNSVPELMTEIKRAPFDGYILDWKLRGGTVLPLIAMIREQTQHGAIALVSGKFRDSALNTQELAEASTNFNFRTFEKPAQLDFIVAALARDGLAPAQAGRARLASP